MPLYYDDTGTPIYPGTDSDYDSVEKRELHCAALPVLRTIITEGWLRPSWGFVKGRPTVYGPRAAVCFTEMTLGAYITYARTRGDSERVSRFAIAVRREDMFEAGARPVIYGLSGDHREAGAGDPYAGRGMRCLAASCGIGLKEQYRYVSMSLDPPRLIDWTQEREWRWPFTRVSEFLHGLPLWAPKGQFLARDVIVIVPEAKIAEEVVGLLAHALQDGYTQFDDQYCASTLHRTRVLSLDQLAESKNAEMLRIEDLPFMSLPRVQLPTPSKETCALAREAITFARIAASTALEERRSTMRRSPEGHILATFGFAYVWTYDAQSEVTAALLETGLASAKSGPGYMVTGWGDGLDFEGMIDLAESAAKAAADCLSERLGQPFYVHSRMD